MHRVVLIDGENFLYGIRTLAGSKNVLAPREAFVDYPFRALLEEVLGNDSKAQYLYFGAKLRRYETSPQLLQKSERAIALQARLVSNLQRQAINFIKVGHLRARESDKCTQCGHQEWILLEKGVDVGLAVRMLAESNENTEIVLISSDTDLLPAVRSAKSLGATIVFIGYENRPILSLINLADQYRVITKPMIMAHSKGAI